MTIRVWNAESGEMVGKEFNGHTDWVRSVGLSSDGNWIVSGSDDNTVCIWDAKSGGIVAGPFEGHTDWVWSVVFSPDGARVISGSGDNTIRIWDVVSDQVLSDPSELNIISVHLLVSSAWIWETANSYPSQKPCTGLHISFPTLQTIPTSYPSTMTAKSSAI
jgi:WD40 repeat protein